MSEYPICPKCESKSLNIPPSYTETLMGWSQYTDDDGEYHSHNPNIMTADYSCRKCGCVFQVKSRHSCWCGWSGGESETTIIGNLDDYAWNTINLTSDTSFESIDRVPIHEVRSSKPTAKVGKQ